MTAPSGSAVRKVYVTLVADLFHYGHVRFLQRARACGDYLVAGVLSDELAASYKRRPVLSLDERIAVVEACRFVDEVRVHDRRLSNEWLRENGFTTRVFAVGSEADRRRREAQRGRLSPEYFVEIPYEPGISTTAIIDRIRGRDDLGDEATQSPAGR